MLVNETDDWACEARRYYFNICGKYGIQVQSVMKKLAALDVQAICPLHGPVLKGEALAEAVKLYDTWSKYEPESEGILIAYASIHGGTAATAERMAEILNKKGAKKVVVSFPLSYCRGGCFELRWRRVPHYARLPLSPADQELPEASFRHHRERQLGSLRR